MRRETIPIRSRQLALLGLVVALPILVSAAGAFAYPFGHNATAADVRLVAALLLLIDAQVLWMYRPADDAPEQARLRWLRTRRAQPVKRFVLGALLLSLLVDAAAADRVDAIRRRMGPDDSAIISESRTTLYLIGLITPTLARNFKEATAQSAAIDTVIVDSQGGDVSSALDIANIIRRRKLNVVVDGRCFSACANYLFPAGHLKSLRGQSFLGIHNRTYHYVDRGVSRRATRPAELQSALNKSPDQKTASGLADLQKKESTFFAAIGMSTSLDAAFTAYMERRTRAQSKASAAQSAGSCPTINLWILRRQQVESIGLKHIGDFWEPRTAEEQRLLQIYFKVPPEESFFGSAAELAALCSAPAGPARAP